MNKQGKKHVVINSKISGWRRPNPEDLRWNIRRLLYSFTRPVDEQNKKRSGS